MIIEDKKTLTQQRLTLIESLTVPLAPADRLRIQGELALINAKIKALNTTQAAQLKAAADQRKVAGLAEAQANAGRANARAQAKIHRSSPGPEIDGRGDTGADPIEDDADPGQTAVIEGWIDAVLLRHDIDFTRDGAGELALKVPKKWAGLLEMLLAGITAAARGQELPELPNVPPPAAPRPKKS